MPFIPEAVQVTPTIQVHNAKLQEPIFYDPEEERLETYREFHNRPCIRTNLGKACTSIVIMFISITFVLLIISGFDEENRNKENNNFNATNLLYDDILVILY